MISTNSLLEAVWDEEPDEAARRKLHVHVSNLRKALRPASEALGGEILVTQIPGYRMAVTARELDSLTFEVHIRAAQKSQEANDSLRASFRYGEALALWRGKPFSGLEDPSIVKPAVVRLNALRKQAAVGRLEAELALGRHKDQVAEVTALVESNPQDEHLLRLLMIALYRSGRQADALAAYTRYRLQLREELGLDPGQELSELESRILVQDPGLETPQPGQPDYAVPTILRTTVARQSARISMNGEILVVDRSVTTIGRQADQDIVVKDPRASRIHGVVRRDASGYRYEDKSRNGTRINGEWLTEHRLEAGDQILVGDTVLEFLGESPE